MKHVTGNMSNVDNYSFDDFLLTFFVGHSAFWHDLVRNVERGDEGDNDDWVMDDDMPINLDAVADVVLTTVLNSTQDCVKR